MADRSRLSVHHVLVAVLVAGFGGFVALHTTLLFSGDQPMLLVVRLAWLAGLGLAIALAVSLFVADARPFHG